MQAVHQLIDDVSYLANVIPSTHFVKYIKLSINIAFRQDTVYNNKEEVFVMNNSQIGHGRGDQRLELLFSGND